MSGSTTGDRFFAPFASRPRPPEDELLQPDAGWEGERLRALLAANGPRDLSADALRTEVEGNLWMLSPDAFRYFLPAFLHLGVTSYDSLVSFVGELVLTLTEPTREDVVNSLDRAAEMPPGMGLPTEILQELGRQQLEWFDSGEPISMYRERIAGLSAAERAAILEFLVVIRDEHGDDFPLGELQTAIERASAWRPR